MPNPNPSMMKYQNEKAVYMVTESEKKELEGLRAFYTYMMNLYGEGLEVANWHQNGDTEPLDNFLDSADALVPVTK